MALKDMLVCLDPTDAGERRLRLAAAMARQHRAHLSAAYVFPEAIAGAPPYGSVRVPTGSAWMPQAGLVAGVPVPGVSPGLGEDANRGPALADIVEQRFREEVRQQPDQGDWHLLGPGERDDLLALAATVDLAVYGQSAPDYRVPTGFRPEDILAESGRPLLIVPYAGEFTGVGRRVLIAWDGTREAVRALHDALPLIEAAEFAAVVTVGDTAGEPEGDSPPLSRLIRHLARHGITASAEQAVRGDLAISDVLLSRAADLDIDLIVAGAYHHSPLREALVGGVSRELLDHMTVPLLMSR